MSDETIDSMTQKQKAEYLWTKSNPLFNRVVVDNGRYIRCPKCGCFFEQYDPKHQYIYTLNIVEVECAACGVTWLSKAWDGTEPTSAYLKPGETIHPMLSTFRDEDL